MNKQDPYLPMSAEIIANVQEAKNIFSLDMRITNKEHRQLFAFKPGQFNMLYLYGIGEIPISIVSNPEDNEILQHTIRIVGRVTKAFKLLKPGDYIGIRGPFGRGWPLEIAKNKDVIIVTGGLGCAPTVAVINYILARRNEYGKLIILQGVKHSDDFIFMQKYKKWSESSRTEVHIAAEKSGLQWPWATGHVTDMIKTLDLQAHNSIVMMCGPEGMMLAAINALQQKDIPENNLYLSMERNMQCGIGHCGHCQYGGKFICKDGPVFAYTEIKELFNIPGF